MSSPDGISGDESLPTVQIYKMDPDGPDIATLTNYGFIVLSSSVYVYGEKIAFVSNSGTDTHSHVQKYSQLIQMILIL